MTAANTKMRKSRPAMPEAGKPVRPPDPAEVEVVYESPVPGRLMVVRLPRLLKFVVNPRPPTDTLVPLLLKFSLTPGMSRTDLRYRKPTAVSPIFSCNELWQSLPNRTT